MTIHPTITPTPETTPAPAMPGAVVSVRSEADRLGVHPSTLSEAARKGYLCAGEEVAERARFYEDGRFRGFVPHDARTFDNPTGEATHKHPTFDPSADDDDRLERELLGELPAPGEASAPSEPVADAAPAIERDASDEEPAAVIEHGDGADADELVDGDGAGADELGGESVAEDIDERDVETGPRGPKWLGPVLGGLGVLGWLVAVSGSEGGAE